MLLKIENGAELNPLHFVTVISNDNCKPDLYHGH